MEIDVTRYIDEDCTRWSDSIFNSGLQNIGQITWRNAVEEARESPLCTSEQQDDLRDWIADFGAWTREEIAEMSDTETNALLLQFVAGDIQDMEKFDSYDEYIKDAEDGRVGGNLWCNDDGSWTYYVGC